MKTQTRKVVVAESVFVGDEPEWGTKKELPLTRALSWYSNQKDWKDSKKYTLDYAKNKKFSKDIIQKLESSHEDFYKNLGFVCRMIQKGAPLQKEDWINQRINEIINDSNKTKNTEEEETPKTKTIQDKIFDQATQFINDIEGAVDDFIKNKKSTINQA